MLRLLATLAFLAAIAAAADAPPAAARFLSLFDQLRQAQSAPRHVAFQLSDAEINAYLRYSLKTAPRPGIESVTVKAFPHNYVSTFTIVDFDAVERWKPGTIPSVLRPVLKGKKSIWEIGRAHV